MTTEVFLTEGTIEIWAYFKRLGSYFSPDQGVDLTLIDPAGTTQVNAQSMTEDETGKFKYYYTPASDAELGWWRYSSLGQHGTGIGAKYGKGLGGFELK